MANSSVRLEDSNGHVIQNPTEDQIRATINKIGSGIEHCVLSTGDTFIQTAGSKDGLFVEVNEGSGLREASRADLSPEEVFQIFTGFLSKSMSWKEQFSSSSQTDSFDSPESQNSVEKENRQSFDLKEEAGKMLKREGLHRMKRMLRKKRF